MNPRIVLIVAGLWGCIGSDSVGIGTTPSLAYASWYRARIQAIVR